MKIKIFLFFYLATLTLNAQDNLSALMPYPNHVQTKKGLFSVSPNESLSIETGSLQFAAEQLQEVFQRHFEKKPPIASTGRIKLKINATLENEEQYRLNITPSQILIEGRTIAGVLYGVVTLNQLLTGDVVNTGIGRIQSVFIDDAPAYPYRALMLDPARHFLPVDDVKFYIDQMVKYKYNTLQIHLTDDQGWRIQIKSHPKLTEIGAFRNPKGGNNGPDNGFYTQEQLKDIVQYAAQRNIQVIPEIDVPGHTAAILTAYPDLRCDFLKDSTFIFGKTDNVMLSAANPKVYEVLDDVLHEVSDIFPSKTIHLGGTSRPLSATGQKVPKTFG